MEWGGDDLFAQRDAAARADGDSWVAGLLDGVRPPGPAAKPASGRPQEASAFPELSDAGPDAVEDALALVADPIGRDVVQEPSGRRTWPWIVSAAVVIAAVACIILALAGAGVSQARTDAASAADGLGKADHQASVFLDAHSASELHEPGLWHDLSSRRKANQSLLGQDVSSMDADTARGFASRAGEAEAATTRLTVRARKSLTEKRDADAADALADAVTSARGLLGSTVEDDDTRSSITALRAIVDEAGHLDASSGAERLDAMRSRVDKARDALSDAVSVQSRRAQEKAQQEKAQQEQAQTQEQEQQPVQPAPQSGSTGSNGSGPSAGSGQQQSGSSGWSVPAPDDGSGFPGSDPTL
ncbi:hypothetical protein BW14_08580 [Bifidobacterium sp. UTBIF-68]|nr:hypothetical protein BW14_08580 [Bifidobacterium sp. UTBIF-68]